MVPILLPSCLQNYCKMGFYFVLLKGTFLIAFMNNGR